MILFLEMPHGMHVFIMQFQLKIVNYKYKQYKMSLIPISRKLDSPC